MNDTDVTERNIYNIGKVSELLMSVKDCGACLDDEADNHNWRARLTLWNVEQLEELCHLALKDLEKIREEVKKCEKSYLEDTTQ